jgi:uncharacterized repeat protein (TIGR01451 family)
MADLGDEIRVATGIYTEVQARTGITQAVYISKTVTVRGGYTTTDWSASNPISYPTTLDAQGQGRVLYIMGNISPTVERLRITGGGAAGLGGGPLGRDAGGGVYVVTATVAISNNQVLSNIADYGGGLYFDNSVNVTLIGNTVISNTVAVTGSGSGSYFRDSNGALLIDNLISGNSTVRGAGGGLYFDNSANVTLAGNTIRGNQARPPIPPGGAGGSGGGVFFNNSPVATLNDNIISSNKATLGGGLYFRNSPTATLIFNTIRNNEANHLGGGQKHYGGAYFLSSDNAMLINNTFSGNSAADTCGGVTFRSGSDNALLIGNVVISNSAGSPGFGGNAAGGGLCLIGSNGANFISNTVINNSTFGSGGGLCLISSNGANLISNTIINNNAFGNGGGLYLERSNITLTNNIVADNQITITGGFTGSGSGMYIAGSSPRLSHTTLARSGGGDGSGVYVTDVFGSFSSVAMTNTILVSHTVGITITAGNTATLNGVLWAGNAINTGGEGTTTVTNEYTGNPAFVDVDAGDYHINLTSAAIDKGVNTGVDRDIDGDPRPQGDGYDLGADETGLVVTKYASPDPVQSGEQLTYAIHVTNTSNVDLHATITDTLPPHITQGKTSGGTLIFPGGVLTWTKTITAPGGVWEESVVITVETGYAGPLTNVVQVTTEEGATGVFTETVLSSPTLQLLAFQPSADGYFFTVRLSSALSHTQYVISSYHHTDIEYWQDAVIVTSDSAGVASARVWSRCTVGDILTGTVFVQLEQAGVFQAESNHLDCSSLQIIDDFGSHLVADPINDDWIYRPSPPGPDSIRIWVRDAAGRSELTGTIRIHSTKAGYWLSEQPLVDEGTGLYSYAWSIGGLPRADDYRVQLTLRDDDGGLSGLDAFIKLRGRAVWFWGEAVEGENPRIWAILTNDDYDGNGVGDRDEWLAFSHAPYGVLDPYETTNYLSVYPYISFTGTLVTDTFQTYLTVAHATGEIRIEALAGTHEWVETNQGLQNGKDLCDAILDFNRAGVAPAERFDGIHYDVEHDAWSTDRWDRFIELISYCQTQVDSYNQTHDPIVFGVDIPPHFLTGPGSSDAITSNWDVLKIVDYITLMDYRDFADIRWDGSRTDGIIPRAEAFVVDGNALGKPVVIGVELTSNLYNHVTFIEECPVFMENELRKVSKHFAGDWAYKGLAIHDYSAWKAKDCTIAISGSTAGFVGTNYTFLATVGPITFTPPITYVWQATKQSEVTTTTFELSNAVSFTWSAPGSKVVTVTATNARGITVTDTHFITIRVPPSKVEITGPTTVAVDISYIFTAKVKPITTTPPITYVWQATGQDSPMAHISGLSDTVTFTRTTPGVQVITVTAMNAGGSVTDTHSTMVCPCIYLPVVLKNLRLNTARDPNSTGSSARALTDPGR